MPESFQRYQAIPSAVIHDATLTTIVPLYAVNTMTLTESYHLPPVGSSTARAIVATHDDTLTLTGLLVGPERFAQKFTLERLAESSKRGGFLGAGGNGTLTGLVVETAMTIRAEMQVQSLTFTASAARRDVLEVSVTMQHMPLPGALGTLLDAASVRVAALADWARR